MASRWDGDDRGHGIGDATWLVPGAGELLAAFQDDTWVAEQPELHLLPHVDDWCRNDGRLTLRDTHVDDEHAFVLELEWRGDPAGIGQVRAAVFSLVGSFAESATYVRQRYAAPVGAGSTATLRFEIGTGEPAPVARFAAHGHALVIDVAGAL
jgi:hypothetical protein